MSVFPRLKLSAPSLLRPIKQFAAVILCAGLWAMMALAPALEPTNGAIWLGPGQGTLFRVFAPNAASVGIVGDFNNWNLAAPIAMTEGNESIWFVTIPDAEPYQKYKYLINGNQAWLRKDPVSLRVENSGEGAASIIENLGAYQWSANEANWESGAHLPGVSEMVIYELHLKSFMFRNDGVPYQHGQLFNLAVEHKLDYLKELGINAISLMPVNEFPGDTSWGYNPAFWFAIEESYGTPQDFQYFVDECHKRGIAVIVDVVYNHAGPTDIIHYWDFDGGTVGPLGGNGNWFYTDLRAKTPWGDTEPNWGSGYVRARLVEAARMFITDYHCDGLRVDSTVTIRRDADDGFDWNGPSNADGWSWLQYLNNELRWRKGGRVAMIAEDIANEQWITRNTDDQGGAGFVSQWSPSPIAAVATQISDENRDMNEVARAIGHTQGVNYGLHELVKYYSSHDTVDARNGHYRLPNRIGDPFQQITKSRTKLSFGTIIMSPGVPMIFMGDEFYAIGQWDDDPGHALDWSQLENDRNFWEFSRAAIRIKRTHPAMHTNNLEMPVIDHGRKMVAFKRWDGNGDTLMIVQNWRNTEQSVPVFFGGGEDGTWHEILNSDAAAFGGQNKGNGGSVQVSGGVGNVNCGPYSFVVLSKFQDQFPPAQSWFPWSPTDGELQVEPTLTMFWRWASDATSYDVYFGTTFDAVNNATTASSEFKGNVTPAEFDISGLDDTTTYFWRVDSKNQWGTTKGKIWRFTTKGANVGGNGRALWTPAAPAVTQNVTVFYYPFGGPIDGSASYELHWGINGFQNVADTAMTNTGDGEYSVTIVAPLQAATIDFAVRNENQNYDNNNGADWHIPVSGAPPVVELSPDPPVAGEPLTITYYADRGTLGGSQAIYLHQGFNCWQDTQHVAMTADGPDKWTHTFAIPMNANVVNFVFADGPENASPDYDNNNGQDWAADVSGAIPTLEYAPNPPVPNQNVTITYRDGGRNLEGKPQIYIHRGFNGWQNVSHVAMTNQSPGVWTNTFMVPSGTDEIDMAFNDVADGAPNATWDNNCGQDWHIAVAGADSAAWGATTSQLNPITYQGENPPDWGFQLWNAGQGTLEWTLSKVDTGSGTDWLNMAPLAGSSSAVSEKTDVTVTFNTAALAAGSYTAQIQAADDSGGLLPYVVTINLLVRPLNHIAVSPTVVEITWPESGMTATTSFNVYNEVEGSMVFSVAVADPGATPWLDITPKSGEQGGPIIPAASILVEVDVTGMTRDNYSGELNITAGNADNSPLVLPVMLRSGIVDYDGWLLR